MPALGWIINLAMGAGGETQTPAGSGGMFFERVETYTGGADTMLGYTGGADRLEGFTGGADTMETD